MEDRQISVRATLRVRNDALISAREIRGLTQRQTAEASNVPCDVVSELERFDFSRKIDLGKFAQRLADFLDIPLCKILPDNHLGRKVSSSIQRIVQCDPDSLSRMEDAGRFVGQPLMIGSSAVPIDSAIHGELSERINSVLLTLTKREREVIELRFGLNGNDPLSLEAVSKRLTITRQRVCQIESHAIRKIRHDTRKKRLVDFAEP